jgi:NADH:ubiquinone oxidoreductase subunit C
MLVWFFSFLKSFSGVYILTTKLRAGFDFSFIVASWLVYLCGIFIRFSSGMYRTWLVEHGGYEVLYNGLSRNSDSMVGNTTVLWYSFLSVSGYRFIMFLISMKLKSSVSLERVYRNARWLEKETGEMHDWYFTCKRDRRALFLVPLLYWAPLRKVFPVSGFYEIRLNPRDGSLYPSHVSWLD